MNVSGGRNREQRILVIKLRYIGDTVLITPLIKALKEGLPGSTIDVMVYGTSRAVLIGNSYVRRIWTLDQKQAKGSFLYSLRFMNHLRRQNYTMVADLTNNDRSSFYTFFTGAPLRIGFTSAHSIRKKLLYTEVIDSILGRNHAVDHHLKVAEFLGLPVADRHPYLEVPSEAEERMASKLMDLGMDAARPLVLMYPGARRWYKRWPPARFAALADRIHQNFQAAVVFCGGPEDAAISDNIRRKMSSSVFDVTGELSLLDFAALARRAVCLIGNDSAPIHIAAAVRTPTISLFGPTDWRVWAPRRDQDHVIAAEFPCRPCGHGQRDCHLGENYCMSTIDLEAVWTTVRDVLSSCLSEAQGRL